MTLAQIRTEIQGIRFNTYTAGVTLARLNFWISAAEAWVWNAADWEFKRVPATNLTVTAGAASESADFGKAIRLYDPRGCEVPYLRPDDFEENYTAPVPAPSGNAEAYTVINRQLIVGPPETGIFKLAYRRRYSHFNNAAAVVAGPMSIDTDYPLWDSEFHYVLVPTAIILGEKLEADPTAEGLRSERDELLASMRDEHLSGVEGEIAFWGGR